MNEINLKSSLQNRGFAVIALLCAIFCFADYVLQIGLLKQWASLGLPALVLIVLFLRQDIKVIWMFITGISTGLFGLVMMLARDLVILKSAGLIMILMAATFMGTVIKKLKTGSP